MLDESKLVNYLSWLEYKKIKGIVRYYPTMKMYVDYRLFATENNLYSFCCECSLHRGFALLIEHLRNRLND